MSARPDPSEYAPYFGKYIALVPGDDILGAFESETAATLALLGNITEQQSLYRYATGKWSIGETIVHIADTERVFAYRALRFARADAAELGSFEPDDYVVPSGADSRSWRSIVDEYVAVRQATVALFRNLPFDAWARTGVGGGNRMSVRALAYNILGHDIHHRNVLRERYL
ncbi:MAG TPA: DinB family protein [Thermoanaerobaculia bacterium]